MYNFPWRDVHINSLSIFITINGFRMKENVNEGRIFFVLIFKNFCLILNLKHIISKMLLSKIENTFYGGTVLVFYLYKSNMVK